MIKCLVISLISVSNVGEMLELSEAIRDYHDGSEFPYMVSQCLNNLMMFLWEYLHGLFLRNNRLVMAIFAE